MKVKVCGLTRQEDVRLACALGAWAVGFVFAPGPRQVTRKQVQSLRDAVIPGVLAVGVFVDAPREDILLALRDCRLDAIQLHGRETPQDCRGYSVPVFKALAHSGETELSQFKAYKVDRFLLEPARTPEERSAGRGPSQPAQKACWRYADRARGFSIILAGGLRPDNVAQAAKAARPYAVDVSGGVESRPGRKDPARLEAFFQALL